MEWSLKQKKWLWLLITGQLKATSLTTHLIDWNNCRWGFLKLPCLLWCVHCIVPVPSEWGNMRENSVNRSPCTAWSERLSPLLKTAERQTSHAGSANELSTWASLQGSERTRGLGQTCQHSPAWHLTLTRAEKEPADRPFWAAPTGWPKHKKGASLTSLTSAVKRRVLCGLKLSPQLYWLVYTNDRDE